MTDIKEFLIKKIYEGETDGKNWYVHFTVRDIIYVLKLALPEEYRNIVAIYPKDPYIVMKIDIKKYKELIESR